VVVIEAVSADEAWKRRAAAAGIIDVTDGTGGGGGKGGGTTSAGAAGAAGAEDEDHAAFLELSETHERARAESLKKKADPEAKVATEAEGEAEYVKNVFYNRI
jgi:hypothetical protein